MTWDVLGGVKQQAYGRKEIPNRRTGGNTKAPTPKAWGLCCDGTLF